ncbi:hypothetical protein [Janibacter massiliensis]|uniref:hypothetical protein n=1 Tax=Janibacter massiliensis TaxID=2058291 RepID=UPI001F3079E5|nr:hypothetical protein [Janibacter massiliensis]
MPAAVMAMWSTLAFVPAMRRSCRTATDSASDFYVSQFVDKTTGVHGLIRKSDFC